MLVICKNEKSLYVLVVLFFTGYYVWILYLLILGLYFFVKIFVVKRKRDVY